MFFWLLSAPVYAKHIAGGEVSYVYLGKGTAANTARYRVTLKLYRECETNPTEIEPYVILSIYASSVGGPVVKSLKVNQSRLETITLAKPDPCISNPPAICYNIGYYAEEVELPITADGYTIAFQRCCRILDLFNVFTAGEVGVTYSTRIPGTGLVTDGYANSTPQFNTSDTIIICANNYFNYDFGATDVDKDQLSYAFAAAFLGGTKGGVPIDATAPPYIPLDYAFGFSPQQPLGKNVSIDQATGRITGTAPDVGIYVITVAVAERRNGQLINVHRKDLHLKVADCNVAGADLPPATISCDGYTINFKNNSTSPLNKSFEWDFGIAASSTDVSSLPAPSFTFPAPGDYTVRLITNKGQTCTDTAYTIAKVYPGFTGDFSILESCKGAPYSFTDKTQSAYGIVNKWQWDFGNPLVADDTSNAKTVVYTYPQYGNYTVTLVVSNDLGCTATLKKAITVGDKPSIYLTSDTIVCSGDTVQLNAGGTGSFSWSPSYNISNTGISNPLVSPAVPTRYTVTLTQSPGCINSASVFVDVKTFVSLKAGMDTTICLGDSIFLRPFSDGVNYQWSPTATVSNPSAKNTWVRPTQTTRYSVLATIGKCQANDGFVVTTVPYPVASAGLDTFICYGSQVRLRATGGARYLWYPGNTLDDQTRQDPIASPWDTTNYVVGVYEDKGCPRPVYDTVRVSVVPRVKAFAGNDTVAVIGQPLQLLATGGLNYSWSPTSFLNNGLIAGPVAKLNDDISYVVRVATKEGCFAFDTVKVKVYKTPPEIFVPTAFTPNDDGLNDRLIPIPVGIARIVYFKVYNRYGELVFSTEEIGRGWNGVYKGRDQGNESFVWHALGVDYLGSPVFRKGESTLIR